ncbi:MAG: hypothetical protein EA367_02310 [Leptolyngbya sp. DLM2.Bin15]|nr:MAG: hypothetical protein EA367_02310 [Leptolyngbya sp. DLM2.Bin15]
MLISLGNHVINTDHITHCEFVPVLPGGDLDENEVYIFFLGDGELSLEGEDALKFWKYLQTFLVADKVSDRTVSPQRLTA